METSAKNGFNVMKLFCDAAKLLYEESIQNKEIIKVRSIINNYIYDYYRMLTRK